MRNIIPAIFYGNIFYGLCALALCFETNLQHHLPLNGLYFYFLIFAITAVYYTRIYYRSSRSASTNKRTLWYSQHHFQIKVALWVAVALILVDLVIIAVKYLVAATTLHLIQWSLMVVFPVIAFMYTFKTFPLIKSRQLRSIGWLKPFFIGFAWSGLVTVYPVFFGQMQQGVLATQFILPSALFWLQNFLFISALAIMFDVKDYVADIRYQLRTYPAILGIRQTIVYLVIPIAAVSYILLAFFLTRQQAPVTHFIIQSVPYLLLFITTGMLKQRSILFYLAAVDGLMLLKGLCGIASILFF